MNSSQDFVPIEEVRNNLIFLKDGTVSLIISTSAVNFGLLFETEQMAIIESFAGLLNSLSFPIQIVVMSQRLDVTSYLNTLDQAASVQTNPLLKEMTARFRYFIESIIKENNVLDKQFYVCVSAAAVELGILSKNTSEKEKKALTILGPRKDHLIRQLGKIGLKSKQLNQVELIKLFYNIYNPQNGTEANPTLRPPITKPPPLIRYQPPLPINNTSSSLIRPFPPNIGPRPITPTQTAPNNTAASSSTIKLSPPFVVEELND